MASSGSRSNCPRSQRPSFHENDKMPERPSINVDLSDSRASRVSITASSALADDLLHKLDGLAF
jgi:hypothetical protein